MSTTRPFTRRWFFGPFALTVCAFIAVLPGCGGKSDPGKSEDSGKPGQTSKNGSPEAGTPEKEVQAALAGVIASLESRDFKTFITKYVPTDVVKAAQKDIGLDAMIAELSGMDKQQPRAYPAMIALLKKYQQVTPTIDAGKTTARFKLVTAKAETITGGETPLTRVKNANPQVTGYGGDLKAALKSALADVKAGKFAAYLQNMLPVSELKLNSVDDLAKRIAASKSAAKQIVADLTAMQSATPVMDSTGTVATYTVAPRVFKFQKVDGNWRLFDNTSALQKSVAGLERKTKESADVFEIVKSDGGWRLTRSSMEALMDAAESASPKRRRAPDEKVKEPDR